MEFSFESDPELKQFFRTDVKRMGKVLGNGSFGTVELVTLSGAPCAAKKLHSILIDSQNIGTGKLIENFRRECRIMSMLRHPNVVRFLGLCTFEESLYPVLLMDCLDTCLHDFLTTPGINRSLSMETKTSVLLDVAVGLTYLHIHNPPIIHRDLTAKNVLLVLPTIRAKIGDLGNSRVLNLEMPLTQLPGTIAYMPPEAFESSYNNKIDIFSFGHLALFTILQEFPCQLLPPNHIHKGKLVPRSEVQRRSKYFNNLESQLDEKSPMLRLIEECLNNDPQRRPTAEEVAQKLRKQGTSSMGFRVKESIGSHLFEAKTKLIQTGSPGLLELRKNRKIIMKESTKIMWRQFIFQITELKPANRCLKYYKSVSMDRVMGELKLSLVTEVKKRAALQFEINFEGRGSPWILRAHEEEERMCWMEAIMPGSSQLFPISGRHMPIRSSIYKCVDVASDEKDVTGAKKYHDKHKHGQQQQENPGLGNREKYNFEEHKGLCQTRCPPPSYKPPLPPKPQHQQKPNPEQQKKPQPAPPIDKQHKKMLPESQIYAEQLLVNFTQEQLVQLLEMFQSLSPDSDSVQVKKQASGFVDIEETSTQYQNVKESQQQFENHARKVPEVSHIPHEQSNPVRQNFLLPTGPTIYYPSTLKQPPHPSPHHSPHSSPLHSPQPSPLHSPHPSPHHSSNKNTRVPDKFVLESLGRVLSQSPAVSTKMLVTDDRQLCPQWTKAKPRVTYSQDMFMDNRSDLKSDSATFFINVHDLSEMILIKSGQFGSVYKAKLRSRGNTQVAVKTIRHYETEKETRDFMHEMRAMSQVMHPNIAQLYGIVEKQFWIVLEYLPNGDLKNFLINHKRPVRILIKYMIDVAMGMHCLSEKGLIHRDLAARNIMVSANEMCKVADFGLMHKLPDDEEYLTGSTTAKKPIRWMAPESLTEKKFSIASDVWSFGVLQWEMFNPTKIPYEELSTTQCIAMIPSGHRMEIPQECPETVADIMKACWLNKAAKRPSFLLISLLLAKLI